MNIWLWALFSFMAGLLHAAEIEKVSLPLIQDVQRADVYALKLTSHPVAVLVLSPGFNGNGKGWIENPAWQQFAREHELGLVGLSFASDGNQLRKGRGYYYPDQGSGQLLLDSIDRMFGSNVPLLLYGFSGGAHFTSGFAEWHPEQVKGWCAYSAEWWNTPSPKHKSPPGLIICGDKDERYGASLTYFKEGRALGKPWLWLSVPDYGHSASSQAEDFVRHYFAAILDAKTSVEEGQWVDVDLKSTAEDVTLRNQPSLTGWLPKETLFVEWKELHAP